MVFKKINNFSTPPRSRGHKGLGEILRWVVNSHNPGFKNSAEEIPKEKVRQRKSELSPAVPGRLPIAFHLSARRAPRTCGVLALSGPTPSSHLAPAQHQRLGHGAVPLYPNLCPAGSSDPPPAPSLTAPLALRGWQPLREAFVDFLLLQPCLTMRGTNLERQ